MTIRAVILGLLLGLAISAGTYFNDYVIRQTMLIGNHLPVSVFGVAVILLLVINPLLRIGGYRLPLRGAEIGIIVAIGLAACGWPGSGLFRAFSMITALPAHWLKTNADWQAAHVMSYVPGASPEMGSGQVQDWPTLLKDLTRPADAATHILAASLTSQTRRAIAQATADAHLSSDERDTLLRMFNHDLIDPVGQAALYARLDAAGLLPGQARPMLAQRHAILKQVKQLLAGDMQARAPDQAYIEFLQRKAQQREREANRAALSALAGSSVVLPAPQGGGVLVADGRADPYVVDALMQGRGPGQELSLTQLPWGAWWPVIRLWWSLALLMGLGALCLTLIVHPQWSRRELLPYPIARFVEEAVEREPGAWFPAVARQRLFWIGFVSLVAIHSLNGIHVWFNQIPQIPLYLNLNELRELFPTASRVNGSYGYLTPHLYPSVIAFSFFLTTSVSFSLGIAEALFMVFGSVLLVQSIPMEQGWASSGNLALMRFGAYLGIALMIGYTGRRYYANVLASAVGFPRAKETPAWATWAARGLIVTMVLAVLLLRTAGLDWVMGSLLVLLVLLIFLVMTRILVETGAFFVQVAWLPVGVLTGLFGFDAIGPTAYVVLAMASVMLIADPRELLMPFLASGMQIADRTADVRPSRIGPWLAAMVITGLIVAGSATLYLQYNKGLGRVDEWTKRSLPSMVFNRMSLDIAKAKANGTIQEAARPGGEFSRIDPVPKSYQWALLGLVLVVGCAAARLRFDWWPLHPVAFLVWGTYPGAAFAFSFLLGWIVKVSVVRVSGARGFHTVKPLMIGVIAGELFAALLWIAIGAGYYLATSQAPMSYRIFPG